MNEKAYCRCCGQLCQPEKYRRPAEDYDSDQSLGMLVDDWRSPCCKNGLSDIPVTDRCEMCDTVAARGASFAKVDRSVLCPACMADYRKDYPN